MMKNSIRNSFIIIYLLLNLSSKVKANDSIYLHVSVNNNKQINQWGDLNLHLTIHNNSRNTLMIEKTPAWGLIQDGIGTLVIKLQLKNKDGIFCDVFSDATYDNFPNLGLYDTLAFKHFRDYQFHLGTLWQFGVGVYRVKVYATLFLLNSDDKVFESDWCNFKINKILRRKEDLQVKLHTFSNPLSL